MKRFLAFLMATVLILGLCGCSGREKGKSSSERDTVIENLDDAKALSIGATYGADGISLADFMRKNGSGKLNAKYIVKLYKTADEVTKAASKGEIEVAMLPMSEAFSLVKNQNGAVKLMAVNISKNLFASAKSDISAITDFSGKKICVLGNDEAEYLDAMLKKSNVKATVTKVTTAFDFQLAVSENNNDILVSAEPYNSAVSDYSAQYKKCIALEPLFESAFQKMEISTGCIVVNNEFAVTSKKHTSEFINDYKDSISKCLNSDDELLQFICDYGMCSSLEKAKTATKNCGAAYIDSLDTFKNYAELFGKSYGITSAEISNYILK